MPLTPFRTYKVKRIDPCIDPHLASEVAVNLLESTTYKAGQVLGELIGTDEVQTVTVDATGGVWVFTLSGQSTPNVAYNIAPEDLQLAIEQLSTVGGGNVHVTRTGAGPYVYRIAYIRAMGSQNVAAATTTATGLTGGAGTAVVATLVAGVAGVRGKFAPYDNAAGDGRNVARGILRYGCVTDAAGLITLGDGPAGTSEWGHTTRSIDMWERGTFDTSHLVGLDANAITDLGRLIDGTVEQGRLMIG